MERSSSPDQPCVVQIRDIYGRPDRDVFVHDLEEARRVAGNDKAEFGDVTRLGDPDPGRQPRAVIWPVSWAVASTVTADTEGNSRPSSGYPQVLERGCVIELRRSRNGDLRTVISGADEHDEVCTVAGHLDDNTAAAMIDFGRREFDAGYKAGSASIQIALRRLIDAPSNEALEALTRR